MTTIKLNNENKTEINFSYDNGLPYKKAIRPAIEYGDWIDNNKIALIKINLTSEDLKLFSNINNIDFGLIKKIDKEIWFDLSDVYLVLKANTYLDNKIKNMKFMLAFCNNNHCLCSVGFDK